MREVKKATLKKNLWKSINVMLRLNLYAKTTKRMTLLAEDKHLG